MAPLHPVPAQVLEWRQLTKLKSTYADALGENIDGETGRVHTSFALAATATGRLSSSEPNIQNIPIRTEEGRKIRRAFVAEPGHLLLSADYSQIELRLAAHVADIAELKRAFREGIDIHALTASEVFGVPLDRMDPLTRRRAKAINFGIIYGISAFGLGNQIGVPQYEAAEYIRAYLDRFPAIRAYMERIKTEARQAGYVETIFGRKCFIPGIRDANPARRAGAERQAINAPLQGAAADIIKRAMGRLPAALAAAGLKARMLLQVHDELLFEAPEAEVEATARLVKAGHGRRLRDRAANCRCRWSSKPAGPRAGTRRISIGLGPRRSQRSACKPSAICGLHVAAPSCRVRKPGFGSAPAARHERQLRAEIVERLGQGGRDPDALAAAQHGELRLAAAARADLTIVYSALSWVWRKIENSACPSRWSIA